MPHELASFAPTEGGFGIDPVSIGISIATKLFASAFGESGDQVPEEAKQARQILLAFATGRTENPIAALEGSKRPGKFGDILRDIGGRTKGVNEAAQGLFPEQEILERAFGAIRSRITRQKQGASAKFASLGLDPRSGLAQQGLSGIQRTEAGAQGGAAAGVKIAKSRLRMDALRQLAGLPPNPSGGLDIPNTIASIGQDFVQRRDLSKIFGNRTSSRDQLRKELNF